MPDAGNEPTYYGLDILALSMGELFRIYGLTPWFPLSVCLKPFRRWLDFEPRLAFPLPERPADLAITPEEAPADVRSRLNGMIEQLREHGFQPMGWFSETRTVPSAPHVSVCLTGPQGRAVAICTSYIGSQRLRRWRPDQVVFASFTTGNELWTTCDTAMLRPLKHERCQCHNRSLSDLWMIHQSRIKNAELVTIEESEALPQAVDWLRQRTQAAIDRGIYRPVSKEKVEQLRTAAAEGSSESPASRPVDNAGCLTLVLTYTALMHAFLLHHELPGGSRLDPSPLFQSAAFALLALVGVVKLAGWLANSSAE